MAASTYLRMLEVALPHIKPMMDGSPGLWLTDVHHDDGCQHHPCGCEPEILFTRIGDDKPLIRLSIVDGQLSIELNNAVLQ
jgi:hypothetical protein